jgi:hypothetical protein
LSLPCFGLDWSQCEGLAYVLNDVFTAF